MTAKKSPTTKERIAKVLRVNTYSLTHVIVPHKPVPPIATAQRPVPASGVRARRRRAHTVNAPGC